MAQAASTATPGLFLDPNPISAPEGALAVADNCIVRYQDTLESRRGFDVFAAENNLLAFGLFGSTLLAADAGQPYYWNGSSFTALGSITAPLGTNPKTQFFSSQGALYVTSGTGLQRTATLSGGSLQLAGLVRAAAAISNQQGTVVLPANNLLAPGAAVAYEFVYQRQVGTLFSILSPPSTPITIVNTTGGVATPSLAVPIGVQLVAGDVVQVYRTVTAASGIPSSEFFLVSEYTVATPIPGSREFVLIDNTADPALGVALYTNASQEGAGQENDPPPLGGDVAQFMGYTIYANTAGYQSMVLTLRGTGNSSVLGIQVNDLITIAVPGFAPITYQAGFSFATNAYSTWTIPYVLQSLADAIGSGNQFQASVALASNSILLEATSPLTPQWQVTFSNAGLPIPAAQLTQTTSTVATIANTGFTAPPVGSQFILAPTGTADVHFPAGTYTVTASSGSSFSYTNFATAGTVSTQNYHWTPAYPWNAWTVQGQVTTTPGLYFSSNSADVAGLSFSKFQQPEAVPLENSLTVGNPSFPITRIIPLRQSVLIFKAGDGIWQLTGTDPTTFAAVPYDLTTQIAQAWSAVAIGDTACLVSTKGPVGCNESGGVYPLAPNGADCPIREEIAAIVATSSNANTMMAAAYESEKNYILWTPFTSAIGGYAFCQEAWVFNLATEAWTRWPLNAQACIVTATADNKLYYTDGTTVFVERKNYAASDYQDVGGTVTASGASGLVLSFSSAPPLLVGDKVTQGTAARWVLSVAGNTATLIGGSGSFSAGVIRYARAITCVATRLPRAGTDGNAGLSHRFQEVAYNFRTLTAPFVTVSASTSLSPSVDQYVVTPTVDPASYGVTIRKGMTTNNTQAVLLQTGFTHAAALCPFRLQATSLVDEPVSTRLGGG